MLDARTICLIFCFLFVSCYSSEYHYDEYDLCREKFYNRINTQPLKFPIYVNVIDNLNDREIAQLDNAITFWNSSVNATLFQRTTNVETEQTCQYAEITTIDKFENDSILGHTIWNDCRANIIMRRNLINESLLNDSLANEKLLRMVFEHELGHSINLRHENNSIMDGSFTSDDEFISETTMCNLELMLLESSIDEYR